MAAGLWAQARGKGRPTAPDEALDADVILAAQAKEIERDGRQGVVIATTNPRHLSYFADARVWQEITL